MIFSPVPIPALFKERLNRFEAIIIIDGTEHICHVPNTGRLKELLIRDTTVYVQFCDNPKRKTRYKLLLVEKEGCLVSIDSSNVPNKVMEEWLKRGELGEFLGYDKIEREQTYGNSRFDFLLERQNEKCFIEVKGVTLVNNKHASFPDAPTQRGVKHLEELIKAKAQGYRAAVVFVIQREDVDFFTPNDEIDSNFSNKLREAYKEGVEIYAYNCCVEKNKIIYNKKIDLKI